MNYNNILISSLRLLRQFLFHVFKDKDMQNNSHLKIVAQNRLQNEVKFDDFVCNINTHKHKTDEYGKENAESNVWFSYIVIYTSDSYWETKISS